MLMKGFEGQITTASAFRNAASRSGCGRARSAPSNASARTDRCSPLAHEIVLKADPPRLGLHLRAHGIVAGWQHAWTDAEPPAQIGGNRRQGFPGPQAHRALHVQRKVAVAEPEPGLAAERRQRLHERPGLVAPAPAKFVLSRPASV